MPNQTEQQQKIASIMYRLWKESTDIEGCKVARNSTVYFQGQARTVARIAACYHFYDGNMNAMPEDRWITTACGTKNCIRKEHLILTDRGAKRLTEAEKRERKQERAEAKKAVEAQAVEQAMQELIEEFGTNILSVSK